MQVILIQLISVSILILLYPSTTTAIVILLLCDDEPLHDLLLCDDLLHDRALSPVEEVRVAASPCMVAMRCLGTHQVIVVVWELLLRRVEVVFVSQ